MATHAHTPENNRAKILVHGCYSADWLLCMLAITVHNQNNSSGETGAICCFTVQRACCSLGNQL